MLCLLCRHTDDGVFCDFPKISDHFPNISENSSNLVRRSHDCCRTFFENVRRLPKNFEEHPKMFRPYTAKFKYSLREKHYINEVNDIFTSEDMKNTPPDSSFTSGVFSSKTLVSIYHMAVSHKDSEQLNSRI